MDAFERIVRRIVEGQVRGFAKEHPVVVEAVDWYKPRIDKQTTFVNSISKRIVRDLLCPSSRARLVEALLSSQNDAPQQSSSGTSTAGDEPRSAILSGSGSPAS